MTHARVAIYRTLFEVDERALPRGRATLLSFVRLTFVTFDSFFRERLQMRAAALAFFTTLSIVPFAALAFAVAKAVGTYDMLVEETVRPFLAETFRTDPGEEVPEGVDVLRETLDRMLDLVSATDVRGLGVIGFFVLAFTIHRVVRGAEESFDAIWGFPGDRSLHRRVPGHLLVTLVTPAALGSATTVTAATHGQPVMELLDRTIPSPFVVSVLTFVIPPLLVCLGILLLYVVLPSARVRRRSAIIGAIVGGLGWYLLQLLHVRFQLGVARTNALYSGFGAFPIFLVWLHLSWVMVLLGAQVAAAHQNAPTLRQLARRRLDDHKSRQAVALRAMVEIARGQEPTRLRSLARALGIGVEPLRDVLDALADHDLLEKSEGTYDPLYVSRTDPDALRVSSVLEALGRDPDDGGVSPWDHDEDTLHQLLEGLQSAAAASAHNRTIGELSRSRRRTEEL